MTAITHDRCALRCATFLEPRFPTAKHLAQAIRCHPDTAADLLRRDAPRLPGPRIMVRLAEMLGDDFVRYVYGPATGWTGADEMEKRIEELRCEADRLARSLQELRAASSSRPEDRGGPSRPSDAGSGVASP